ncbi:NADP-dependent oxidoreductase [Nocardioides terrisoli]|uniref:NADP-dependent oxidoreductase n=1 Tax=Nocardioides terrisoli TaxID=3388267 RepID=UPI00287BC44D|nr:NADP-dependent oxidoreductase [Nocardioides marmorisolisilvae]
MRPSRITLARHPVGLPTASDFSSTTFDLPPLEPGQVLLRVIYLSLDPYVRGRLSDAKSYASGIPLGGTIIGETVCEVLESEHDAFATGDLVLSESGWQTHDIVDGSALRRVDPSVAPISTALGVLGMPGFTAYAGLLEIGHPQYGETVVVAAATGPVGSAVGQIARIKGARAVGIAGGADKVRALREHFGFDAAVDHRSPEFREQLKEATPNGVDVYFENVGGEVGDAVIRRMNVHGRIPLCGLVAEINDTGAGSGPDRLSTFLRRALVKRLTVQGFLQAQFLPTHHARFVDEMSAWIRGGEIRYLEDVADGLDNAVDAFVGMLTGRNFGKALVRVSPDPTS